MTAKKEAMSETANDCVACDVEALIDELGPYWSIPFRPWTWIYLRRHRHVCERAEA